MNSLRFPSSRVVLTPGRVLPKQRSRRRIYQRHGIKASNDKTQTDSEKLGEQYSGFAPFTLMSYSSNPAEFCQQNVEILVESDPAHCFEIWNDWPNLLDFLDLIGELAVDPNDPKQAYLFCYYRFVTQNLFLMKKTEEKEFEFIKFASMFGMPLKGIVEFKKHQKGTIVNLRFEHPMPIVLLREKVGVIGVEAHINRILKENLETFKKLSEGKMKFSDEKYDTERAWKELNEMKDAVYNSGWISDETESPFDFSDLGGEPTDYEMFGEE